MGDGTTGSLPTPKAHEKPLQCPRPPFDEGDAARRARVPGALRDAPLDCENEDAPRCCE